MKLKKNEIKYLSQSFVPQTPLSVFGNIEASLDGSEYQSLTDKGVIVGNAYSKEALEILTLLTGPQRGARFLAQTPNYIVEKYSYKTGDKTVLSENHEGELEFSVMADTTLLSSKFTETFGVSAFSTTEIEDSFTPEEMTALFALTDLLRKDLLAKYADFKQTEARYSEEAVLKEVSGDYRNGLKGMFLKNYRLEIPGANEIRNALASLEKREIVSNSGGYTLKGEYRRFAENFLVMDTICFYEAFAILPAGEVATMAKLAASAGKNDILALFYDGDVVQFNTISAVQLLYNIEAIMSCPEFIPPAEPIVPPAPAPTATAPATASQAPSVQAAPGSWTCSCGRVNTGNFCAACGSRKP